jgi:PAT family beta-lactamase induction signal transducer AmpG
VVSVVSKAGRNEPKWLRGLSVYLDRQVLAIVFLGFSAGIPLALTGQTLSVWMKEAGVSLTTIGLFALVGVPYVFKFVWAPLIDATRVPILGRILGRRRGWLVTTQLLLIGAVFGLGSIDPVADPLATVLLALLVAFASASQDIVIDAFRVEYLREEQQAAGVATYSAGYRVAMLVATAGVFEFVAYLQNAGFAGNAGWFVGYGAMAVLVVVGLVVAVVLPEPAPPALPAAAGATMGERLKRAVWAPFAEFMSRDGWIAILLFVTLFKFGDAFAGIMTAPFVLDIGFDKTDYGRIVKVFGLLATLVGALAGGWAVAAFGTRPALWIGALVQAASNLMFVVLALIGADYAMLVATIGVENATGGFGSMVFVAYLAGLCRDRAYTATQYALLSALAAVGRTVLSSSAGWFATQLGWPLFFVLTTAAAVPGILFLVILSRRRLGFTST